MSDSDEKTKSMPKKVNKLKPISVSTKGAASTVKPRTSVMVLAAIKELNEKNGSSLQAIKKYILATYNMDTTTNWSHIKKFLKNAVVSGELKQVKGRGASGSFKIAIKNIKPSKPSKPKVAEVIKKTVKQSATTKTVQTKVKSKTVTAGVVKKPKDVVTKVVTAKSSKTPSAKVKAVSSVKNKVVKSKKVKSAE